MIERAAVEGKVFHEGAVAELAPEALRPAVADAPRGAGAQGADPAGPAEPRRAHLPLPPSPDPRRRLRLDPEGGARGAARAVRPLARASGRRPGDRVRRDRRLPPRAGVSATGPSSGRSTTRRAALAREAAERLGVGRPPRVRPRRRARGREPDLPRRRVAAGRRSAARRPGPERPRRAGAERRPQLGRPGADGGCRGSSDDGRPAPGGARARAARVPAAVHAAGRRRREELHRGRRARDRRLRRARRRAGPRARLAARRPGALPRPPGAPSAEASERALEHARRADDGSRSGRSSSGSASRSCSGRRRRRRRPPLRAPARRDVRTDPILEPTVLAVLANARGDAGTRRARRTSCSRRRRAAMDELGESIWLVGDQLRVRRAGRTIPVAAERELRPGYEALKRIGEKSHFSSIAGLLSRACTRRGATTRPSS